MTVGTLTVIIGIIVFIPIMVFAIRDINKANGTWGAFFITALMMVVIMCAIIGVILAMEWIAMNWSVKL